MVPTGLWDQHLWTWPIPAGLLYYSQHTNMFFIWNCFLPGFEYSIRLCSYTNSKICNYAMLYNCGQSRSREKKCILSYKLLSHSFGPLFVMGASGVKGGISFWGWYWQQSLCPSKKLTFCICSGFLLPVELWDMMVKNSNFSHFCPPLFNMLSY